MSACNAKQPSLFNHEQKPNTLTTAERQRLVEDVIPMCRKFARDKMSKIEEFLGGRLTIEDLEAECYLAATHAAEKFDKSRGNEFSTACYSFLNKHITAFLQNYWHEKPAGQYDETRGGEVLEEGDAEPCLVEPDDAEALLLANLTGDAREVVRLMVFDELTPEQVATQMGKAVKDVRLIARNSAKHLQGVKTRQRGPNLFAMPSVETNDV
jgi:DNA-directed RNA polymerase specialized sigma24 family protein